MELSKEQIVSLEQYLEKRGLKYWDIRMELLDHLATDIELRIAKGESFQSAKESAIYALGLSGNLEGFTKRKLLGINKIVRKQFFYKTAELFTKPTYLVQLLCFISCYAFIYAFASLTVFKFITIILLFLPISVGVILYFSEFFKKRKSGYLTYTSFYIFFSFMMLNLFLQLPKPNGIFPVTKETQLFIWFLVTCVNSIFASAGILIHINAVKKIKTIQRALFDS